MSELAHDEDGNQIESQGFDYDAVEVSTPGMVEFDEADMDLSKLTPEEIAIGLEVMDKLLKWVWQSGMNDKKGITIRSIILCWVCLKQLRPFPMSVMAVGLKMKKQSLDRWVNKERHSFKKVFPTVKTPNAE